MVAWLEVPVRSMMAIIAVVTTVPAVPVVQMMAASRDEQSCRSQNHQPK